MVEFLSAENSGSKSRLSNAVAGINDAAAIRELLFDMGIQSFRKMAGHIPAEMSLENEPKRMLKDWRSCPFRTRFSEYHFRWLQVNYGDMPLSGFVGWPHIPWQADTDLGCPECCRLSANACGLSRRNKLTFG